MALPIAPTPVLTGESARELERYMSESEFNRKPIPEPNIDMEKFAVLHAKMMERRDRMKNGTEKPL